MIFLKQSFTTSLLLASLLGIFSTSLSAMNVFDFFKDNAYWNQIYYNEVFDRYWWLSNNCKKEAIKQSLESPAWSKLNEDEHSELIGLLYKTDCIPLSFFIYKEVNVKRTFENDMNLCKRIFTVVEELSKHIEIETPAIFLSEHKEYTRSIEFLWDHQGENGCKFFYIVIPKSFFDLRIIDRLSSNEFNAFLAYEISRIWLIQQCKSGFSAHEEVCLADKNAATITQNTSSLISWLEKTYALFGVAKENAAFNIELPLLKDRITSIKQFNAQQKPVKKNAWDKLCDNMWEEEWYAKWWQKDKPCIDKWKEVYGKVLVEPKKK